MKLDAYELTEAIRVAQSGRFGRLDPKKVTPPESELPRGGRNQVVLAVLGMTGKFKPSEVGWKKHPTGNCCTRLLGYKWLRRHRLGVPGSGIEAIYEVTAAGKRRWQELTGTTKDMHV